MAALASLNMKSYSRLSGVLFRQLQNKKPLITRHWLDTDIEKYYETIEDIVIPECSNIASDVPGYSDRIKKFISHTNPAFDDAWNFGVELIYKTVADKSHQTDENLTKMRILRAIMDLSFTMSAVLDDCSDYSDSRKGKKAWHKVCKGGLSAAIYDGVQMGFFPLYLLQRHFSNDSNYVHMLHVVTMANLGLMIGQTIDVLGFGEKATMDSYKHILHWKAGQFTSPGCALGLLHAGISGDIVTKAMSIWSDIGSLFQIWDDFNDYYCTNDQTGKPSCDIINGSTTWASCTAMANFTPSQAKEFKECYGSSDPEKMARTRQLYDDIDLPSLYIDFMKQRYNEIMADINQLPHQKVQEAMKTFLDWLLGQEVSS